MFGHPCAFVSVQMFMGVFGNAVFVRLPEDLRGELLAEEGAGPFEPMAGRPMKEYVTLPAGLAGRAVEGRALGRPSLVVRRFAAAQGSEAEEDRCRSGRCGVRHAEGLGRGRRRRGLRAPRHRTITFRRRPGRTSSPASRALRSRNLSSAWSTNPMPSTIP